MKPARDVRVRRIQPGEGELLRSLRLAALQDAPRAFSTRYADAVARSAASWAEQADASATGADRATFFAFAAAEPLGLAALYRVGERAGELIQMWVRPAWRGSGVARRLLEHATEFAARSEMDRVRAEVRTDNVAARRCYERFGFRRRTQRADLTELEWRPEP